MEMDVPFPSFLRAMGSISGFRRFYNRCQMSRRFYKRRVPSPTFGDRVIAIIPTHLIPHHSIPQAGRSSLQNKNPSCW